MDRERNEHEEEVCECPLKVGGVCERTRVGVSGWRKGRRGRAYFLTMTSNLPKSALLRQVSLSTGAVRGELGRTLRSHGPDGRQTLGDRREGLNRDRAEQVDGNFPPRLAKVELLEEDAPEVEGLREMR